MVNRTILPCRCRSAAEAEGDQHRGGGRGRARLPGRHLPPRKVPELMAFGGTCIREWHGGPSGVSTEQQARRVRLRGPAGDMMISQTSTTLTCPECQLDGGPFDVDEAALHVATHNRLHMAAPPSPSRSPRYAATSRLPKKDHTTGWAHAARSSPRRHDVSALRAWEGWLLPGGSSCRCPTRTVP